MPYPLNNAETLDQYDDNQTTLIPPRPVPSVRLIIANAATMVALERCDNNMRVGAGFMLPEEFTVPGVYTIERGFLIGRVRIRSHIAGVPAQVSGTAATP